MTHSPAQIMSQAMIDASLFTVPGSSDWPLYISVLPSADGVADQAACVYDVAPVSMGRILRGDHCWKHGVQLMVRDPSYTTGWAKAAASVRALELMHMVNVVIDDTAYLIDSVGLTTHVLSLGQDEYRRAMFTVNMLVMLKGD